MTSMSSNMYTAKGFHVLDVVCQLLVQATYFNAVVCACV